MKISHRQASEIDVHRGPWETPEPHALPVSRPAAPVGQHHADLCHPHVEEIKVLSIQGYQVPDFSI